jgi:hypothetical protein
MYVANMGNQLSFFAWNGVVVLLGRLLFPKDASMTWNVWPINTLLVLVTILPVSHWLTDEYIRSGFYNDVSLGLPLFVYTSHLVPFVDLNMGYQALHFDQSYRIYYRHA